MKSKYTPKEILQLKNCTYDFYEIEDVVSTFYMKVQNDEVLKEPFKTVDDWGEHIKKLTHFWWIRLGGKSYMSIQYNPMMKHFLAGFSEIFLDRWLKMFHEVLEMKLNFEQASIWKELSSQMGKGLLAGNEMYVKKHYR